MDIQRIDYSVDLLKAVLWQYDGSPRLQSLLQQKSDWYGAQQSGFWSDWYRDVFDLNTASEFGLSVWARILGIPLSVDLPPSPLSKPTFGFGDFNDNFFDSNFSRLADAVQNLTTAQKRLVLKLRYLQLVSRGTVPEVNAFLRDLFGPGGGAYVLDGQDMSMTVVFLFVPDSELQFVLEKFDLLPRPAGVGVNYLIVTRDVFGFGDYNLNFYDSNFLES